MGLGARLDCGIWAIAGVASLACGLPARADEAVQQRIVEDPRLAADSAPVSQISGSRIVAADSERPIGPARYALRSHIGGASIVTFVASPPRAPSEGLGSMPEGLPLAGRLSSSYGLRVHPILGGLRWHGGVDLAAPAGTPVRATSDGVVERAAWSGGYGLMVELDHGQGTESLYGHMERITVAAGQSVKKGDLLGYVGSTGLSTGPHLHYEIRRGGHTVDPLRR